MYLKSQTDDPLVCGLSLKIIFAGSHEIVCENGILQMDCPLDYGINVLEANYGRTIKGDVCICKAGQSLAAGNCPTNPNLSNVDNCFSPNSLSILNSTCNSLSECTVSVNNNVFGDPCGGIHKYLEVNYECSKKGRYRLEPVRTGGA